MKDDRISLCAITGNCEGIIGKFIDQFRQIADEICIVRAIGKNQKHDKTLSIALEKGCRVGEFKGQVDDWPHTHHFGDARNAAWDMATCEWVMWADIDDAIDADSIKEFKRLVRDAPENIEMIRAAYVVPDQGITNNIRERIMRRGKFAWHQPVHECVKSIDNHKYDYIDARKACVTHAAKSDRKLSCERNLRILEAIPEKERGSGTHYYLFSEYYGLGEKTKAVQAAETALKFPDIGGTEKYEILLILSTMSKNPDRMAALLHAAHQTLPFRREALVELANLEMTFGNADRAMAYCRQMLALPKPDIIQWNLRGKFYDWAGDQLETSVERFAGREARANALEFNRFKAAGGKISLLHATRGRPLQACKARLTWIEMATNPAAIEHIFAIDEDDIESQCLRRFNHVIVPGSGGCVEAWNCAAFRANGEIFIQLSDDWIPPWNWDELILERLGDLSMSKVLAVSDGQRKDDLLCMAILTRKRWEQQGRIMFHPDFTGVFSDNWFSRKAFQDNVVILARDLEFSHYHPFFGTAPTDATYERQNSKERFETGERIFNQLVVSENRTICTHCSLRLGDNISHLQFLRKLSKRYPLTRFIHSADASYLPQLLEITADCQNIKLDDKIYDGSIEVWKNHEGFFDNHPDKADFVKFYVAWFDELAKRMGLENPIKQADHFIFDYPALIRKTAFDGPFDFLIINSPPLSGQVRQYSDLSVTAKLLLAKGFAVITTMPVEGCRCTREANMTVTDIGALSRHCRFIIMVSTGPSWATFNIFNVSTIELRIIILDNEKINIAPNTAHVQNEVEVLQLLKGKGFL